MSMIPTAPMTSQPGRVFPRFFSLRQATLLIVLALLVGGVAGGLFAFFGLHPKTMPGTKVTIPAAPVVISNAPGSGTLTAFSNSNLSIKYPSDWKETQTGQAYGGITYSFNRNDGVTLLAIGLHDFDGPEDAINNLTGATLSCTTQSSDDHGPTINNITWTSLVVNCGLGGAVYVVTLLSYQNYQTRDETQIAYAGYESVNDPQLISFDQANTQYFQSMLQSLQLK